VGAAVCSCAGDDLRGPRAADAGGVGEEWGDLPAQGGLSVKRGIFWPIAIIVLIIVLFDNCAGTGLTGALLMLVGYALLGWMGFIPRVGPLISWRWEVFWSVIIYASLLLIGGHLFIRWIYREMRRGSDAGSLPRWKFGWSLRIFVLLMCMFCAGTACIAIVHQSTWLA